MRFLYRQWEQLNSCQNLHFKAILNKKISFVVSLYEEKYNKTSQTFWFIRNIFYHNLVAVDLWWRLLHWYCHTCNLLAVIIVNCIENLTSKPLICKWMTPTQHIGQLNTLFILHKLHVHQIGIGTCLFKIFNYM